MFTEQRGEKKGLLAHPPLSGYYNYFVYTYVVYTVISTKKKKE